ncbi:MAG: VapC toxin family PIN domain ribonuclease [Verrucomicrobiales bacterium]|jgi:tRNA(fMet)-specific endonuclease VapC|nr:VapC toxin family PIN domain ribonuclease [Verrucomicrobiales bacterium]MDP6679253.1 type II toxin-antitoxin system VapC family toxin [Verrucomicrobiota bacterium]MDP6752459.1 type II toxin-antitoxin system VapC family toxin [Verrucomicrobiota bacterium]MDP7049936.1 type II toxin-antitoxin system VapC family toxin [Verrucomicrobiota bacterium]
MRYLLDTNICIYLIKRSPPTVMRRFKAVRVGEVALSAITLCELQFGVSNSARPDANQAALIQFLAPFEVRDFPSAAGMVYGEIRTQLLRKGVPIGSLDLLIGAHALHEGVTLVTNNTREFKRIPNLKVENWAR